MAGMSEGTEERVGFRDIYRAVGESEQRVKEHISLALLPIATQLADHEQRLRLIEDEGSTEAKEALATTLDLDTRVTVLEKAETLSFAAGAERRRLGDLSGRMLAAIVVGTNFVLGLILMFANLLTDHRP